MIHFDYRPTKDCTNPDTYGEICVKCNDCGRFDYTCLNCGTKKNPETLGGQVELVDSFREPICDGCVALFSKEELNPTYLKQVIWIKKKDFRRRPQQP